MERVSCGAYGPVLVEVDDELRVGIYDDDDWEDDDSNDVGARRAIVHFCEPPFLFDTQYEIVEPDSLAFVNTDALLRRRSELAEKLVAANNEWFGAPPDVVDSIDPYRVLLEYALVTGLLADRMLEARNNEGDRGGRRVFISHSSKDKDTAVALAVDLGNRGHVPWLDEWAIEVGESIALKIADGLEQSDFVILLMSRTAVDSGWVEAEWTAKYWDEVTERRVRVIPALLDDCQVPTLLKTKKYADLRSNYGTGLSQIIRAIE